jgi:catechol 2,3-dioxygenase-like lactoylglutathione lyase family enzyme
MITGINHINFAVSDISRSFAFYKEILGFTPLCKSEGSAYLLAGNPETPGCLWVSLDLDRQSLRKPSPCNSHVAFSVTPEDFPVLSERILSSGTTVFKENTSPGSSLYFLDPDGHKLEIHVGSWQSRLAGKKENPGNWKNVEWFV